MSSNYELGKLAQALTVNNTSNSVVLSANSLTLETSLSFANSIVGTVAFSNSVSFNSNISATGISSGNVSATSNFNLPVGNTSTRPGAPGYGNMRYNSQIGIAEIYTAEGWLGVDITPTITSISGVINYDTTTTLTISGSNFKSGAIVSIEGAGVDNVSRNLVTTFVSTSTLTVNTNATDVNYVGGASFNVKVTNPSGVSTILAPAGTIDRDPVWTTAAGSLATIYDNTSYANVATLVATDPDSTPITYSIVSGSLPSGLSLGSSTGIISGTTSIIAANTTYPFNVQASSNGIDLVRSFSILVQPKRDGATAARATTPYHLRNTLGVTTNGLYWIKTNNTYNGITMSSAVQAYIFFNLVDSKDWVLMMELNQSSNQGGSIVTTSTPQDSVNSNTPWKGFNVRVNGTDYYSYSATYRAYIASADLTALSGGNYGGYRAFIGQAGGHGWYNTSQSPCNWGNSSGSIGAGYDGSCGSYPTTLRMGTGTGGANYSYVTGNWRFLVWMDTAE